MRHTAPDAALRIAAPGSSGESSWRKSSTTPADDPTQRKPDIAQAGKLLNWSPSVDLDDGLRRTIAYFRELLAV